MAKPSLRLSSCGKGHLLYISYLLRPLPSANLQQRVGPQAGTQQDSGIWLQACQGETESATLHVVWHTLMLVHQAQVGDVWPLLSGHTGQSCSLLLECSVDSGADLQ